ncbi:MAG: YmfQ family protein [Clostridia bacterium]|nr:YmfQ family protein [Clostridia bacterium]
MKAYLSYLPPIFSNIREFSRLGEVIDSFISAAADDIEFVRDGIFITYATGEMLERLEKLYNIKSADGSSDEVRRAALLSRIILPKTAHGLLFPSYAKSTVISAEACTYTVTLSSVTDVLTKQINSIADLALPANLERIIK